MSANWDYSGKLILVTGSTKGIGRCIADKYVAANGRVIFHSRSQEACDNIVKEIKASAIEQKRDIPDVYGIAADLCKPEEVANLAGEIEKLGHLDVLVNNAGAFFVKDFFDLEDADWTRLFEVNVMSGVRLTRIFLKKMLAKDDEGKAKGGNVVFISSECAYRGLPQMLHYSSTKATQMNIVSGLGRMCKGIPNVRVNGILPGPTWTPGVQDYMDGMAKKQQCTVEEAVAKYFKENEPNSLKQKFLDPNEIADSCLFVTSDAASSLNGAAQRAECGILYYV